MDSTTSSSGVVITLDLTHPYKGYIIMNGIRYPLPNHVSRKLRIWTESPIDWTQYKDELAKNQKEMYGK